MKTKIVLFDFDGTLMDTSEGIFYCGKYSLNEIGLSAPEDTNWRNFIGPPLTECFSKVFHITDQKVLENLCDIYRGIYKTEGYKRACFYPGIIDLIKTLRSMGIIVGIASMKHTNLIKMTMTYFDFESLIDCYGGQETNSVINKEDIIIKLCKDNGFSTEECILIGDTDYDYLGAQKAGCDCIKVNWGFGYLPGDEGTLSDADQVLDYIKNKN